MILKVIFANSVDPDQTAPLGSTLFACMQKIDLMSSALSSACDFKSYFCKQCGPRSDCSSRSSLIRVHTVCLYAKNRSEKFVRIFSRGHNQAKFSGADFLGILRVKVRSSRSFNLLALFLGRLSPLSGSPVLVLILAPVTD